MIYYTRLCRERPPIKIFFTFSYSLIINSKKNNIIQETEQDVTDFANNTCIITNWQELFLYKASTQLREINSLLFFFRIILQNPAKSLNSDTRCLNYHHSNLINSHNLVKFWHIKKFLFRTFIRKKYVITTYLISLDIIKKTSKNQGNT